MKINRYLASLLIAAAVGFAGLLHAADGFVRYDAVQGGGKMKIDGTSTVHDWTVEGQLIGGYVEFGSDFDVDNPKPGKVPANASAVIPVRQLKSGKTPMDNVMYDAMKQKDHPRIEYRLTEMTLKEAPKSPTDPLVFDTTGDLTVAGVTNKISMPVNMYRVEKGKLKFTGVTTVKMTSFGIQPPAPKIALGLITTGDDVKLTFEWLTSKNDDAAK
jgi:polyisoprenoid-binding protein YceI